MPDHHDSAIEAGARALREQWPHIFVLAGERADQMAQAVLDAYPEPTKDELKKCREGGQDCLRCQALLDAGLNPHTGEPLESAPSGDQWDVPKADAERASRSKGPLLGASQPVGGRTDNEKTRLQQPVIELVEGEEYVPKSRLIAAEQREDELEGRRLAARSDAAGWRSLCEAAQAEKLRQTANANEFQRKWEAAEQRHQELVDAYGEQTDHFLTLQADRDRLQRELDEWKEGYENLEWSVQTLSPLVARVKALEGALSMLVELKDMQENEHDRYESVEGKLAKRAAWQAARAALSRTTESGDD